MEEGDVFEIEKILDTSVTTNIRYYLVRWKGYGEADDTWEPEENLNDCEEVLKAFWRGSKKPKKKQVRKRKTCEPAAAASTTNVSIQQKKGRSTKNDIKAIDYKLSLTQNNTKSDEVGQKRRTRNVVKAEIEKKINKQSISQHGSAADEETVQEDGHLKNSCDTDQILDPLLDKELYKKDTEQESPLHSTTNQTDIDKIKSTGSGANLNNNINLGESENFDQHSESEKVCEKPLAEVIFDERVSASESSSCQDKEECKTPQGYERLLETTPLAEARISCGMSRVEFQKVLSDQNSKKENCEEEENNIRAPSVLNITKVDDHEDIACNRAEQLCHTPKQEDSSKTSVCEMKYDDHSLDAEAKSVVVDRTHSEEIERVKGFSSVDKEESLATSNVLNAKVRLEKVPSCSPEKIEIQEIVGEEEKLLNEKENPTSMASTNDSKKVHEHDKRDEVIHKQDSNVPKHGKPDMSRIFGNLQKIKKKIALKPFLDDPKTKTEPLNVDIPPKCLTDHCLPPADKNHSLKSTGEDDLELPCNVKNSPAQQQHKTDSYVLHTPVTENSFSKELESREPSSPTVEKKPCHASPQDIKEKNSLISSVVGKHSHENLEENSTDNLENNNLCSISPVVENVSLEKAEESKPSPLHINKNLFLERIEEDFTEDVKNAVLEQTSSMSRMIGTISSSPNQNSVVDCLKMPDSDLKQPSKQPQIISISDDSESTDDEIERKRTSNNFGNLSTTYGYHNGKKKGRAAPTVTATSSKKEHPTKKPDDISSVSNFDVVSQIIKSSSLNAGEVKGNTSNQESHEKDLDVERHDSDMDLCDSDFEFDLDDYNPVELLNEKSVRVNTDPPIQTGIPTAISLRDVKQAIKKGDTGTILASLAGGLDIESQDGVVGMTLLMRAVSTGQDKIVKLLISRGANVNVRDNAGNTPLMLASEQGFSSIACLLLDAEADVNAKQSNSGETALIKACKKGFYPVVSVLVTYGADCQIRSQPGLTASQWAAQCGHFEIRDLLDSHNKKLQSCVEKSIISCLGHASYLIQPPLLSYVCLYPNEGQKFTYHFNCTNLLLDKTVLLYCFRTVFSRTGEVDLSFSRDNGVHTITLNGLLQSPILKNNRSVFKIHPKLDTNLLVVQTYQSHVHLLVCIYAAELDHDFLTIEDSSIMV